MEARTGLVDLHFHSVFSDGSEKLSSIIREAKTRGLVGLALTDHNNANGVPEFLTLCQRVGITAFQGVEIYACFPTEKDWSMDPRYCGPVPDVVVLGKRLNWDVFKELYQLLLMKYWEEYWLPTTLAKLAEAGFWVPALSPQEIKEQIKDFGTPKILHDVPKNPKNWPKLVEHVRRYDPNIKQKDISNNSVRFANRYLYAIGMPAYVLRGPKEFGVKEAVNLAREMNGVLFAAHPGGEYGYWSREHLDYFIQLGGRGIEVWQYFHTQEQIRLFLELAIQHNLLVSGGSDWHGKNGRPTLGCHDRPVVQTPGWVISQLLEKLP